MAEPHGNSRTPVDGAASPLPADSVASSSSQSSELRVLRTLAVEATQQVLDSACSRSERLEPKELSLLEKEIATTRISAAGIHSRSSSSASSISEDLTLPSQSSGTSGEVKLRSRRRKTWRQSLQEQEDEEELLSTEDQLTRLRELKAENRELRCELMEVNTHMTQMENATIGKDRATEGINKSLMKMMQENTDMSRELQNLTIQKEEMRKSRDEADIRSLEVANQLLNYKTKVRKAARERGSLSRSDSGDHTLCEEAQDNLLKTITLLKAEMNALRNDVSEQDGIIETQATTLRELEIFKETAQVERKAREDELRNVRSPPATNDSNTAENLQGKVETLNREIDAYRENIKQSEQLRVILEKRLSVAEDAGSRLLNASKSCEELEQQLQVTRQELEEVRGSLASTGGESVKVEEMTSMLQSQMIVWMFGLSRIQNIIEVERFFTVQDLVSDDVPKNDELAQKMEEFTNKLEALEISISQYKLSVSTEVMMASEGKKLLEEKLKKAETNIERKTIKENDAETNFIQNVQAWIRQATRMKDILTIVDKVEGKRIILTDEAPNSSDLITLSGRLELGLEGVVTGMKRGAEIVRERRKVANETIRNLQEEVEELKAQLMLKPSKATQSLVTGDTSDRNLDKGFRESYKEVFSHFEAEIASVREVLSLKEALMASNVALFESMFDELPDGELPEEFRLRIQEVRSQIQLCNANLLDKEELCREMLDKIRHAFEQMASSSVWSETLCRDSISGKQMELTQSQVSYVGVNNTENELEQAKALITDLKTTVSGLTRELDTCKHELAETQTGESLLASTKRELETKLKSVEMESALTLAQHSKLEESQSDTEIKVRKYEMDLQSHSLEIAKLRATVGDLQSKLTQNEADLKQAEEIARALKSEIASLNAEKAELQQESEKLSLELEVLFERRAHDMEMAAKDDMERLRVDLNDDKDKAVEALQAKIEMSVRQVEEESGKTRNEHMLIVQHLKTTHQKELEQHTSQRKELQSSKTELEHSVARITENLEDCKEEVRTRTEELTELYEHSNIQKQNEVSAKEFRVEIESLKTALASKSNMEAEYEEKASTLKRECEKMIEEQNVTITELKESIYVKDESISKLQKELEDVAQKKSKSETEAEQHLASLTAVQEKGQHLVKKLEEVKGHHSDVVEKLKTVEAEWREQREEVEKLKVLLAGQESSDTKESVEDQCDTLIARHEGVVSQLKVEHELRVSELIEKLENSKHKHQEMLEKLQNNEMESQKDKVEVEKLQVLSANIEHNENVDAETNKCGAREVFLEEQCMQLRELVEKHKDEVREKEDEITGLREQTRQHAITIVTIEERLNSVVLRNREYQSEVDQLKSTIEEMHQRMVGGVALAGSPRTPHPPAQPKLIHNPPASTQPNQAQQSSHQCQNLVRLRRENANLKNQYSQSQKVIESLRRDLNGLAARLSDVSSEISDAKKQELDEKKTKLKDVDRDLDDHKIKVRELFTIVEEKLAENRRLNSEVKRLKEGAAKLKKIALAKEEKVKELEDRLDKHKEELQTQKDKQEEHLKANGHLVTIGSNCRGERHEDVIANQKAALAELRTVIKTLEQVPRAVGSHDAALQQVSLLKKELAEIRAQQALSSTFPNKDISFLTKSPRESGTTVEFERSSHRLTAETLELSEACYLGLLKSVCASLNIEDTAGMRSLSRLPEDEQKRLHREREQSSQIVANRIQLLRERLLRKDELLQGYEEDLAKLRHVEELLSIKEEQIENLTNEVRRRAEESQCLRATLEQTREKGEQERRSTSMKDNKLFPALSRPQVSTEAGKAKEPLKKKEPTDKLKRKNYEIQMLKTELGRKDEQLHNFRRQVILGPNEDYHCCDRKVFELPTFQPFRPTSAKERKLRPNMKTTKRPASAHKASSARGVPSLGAQGELPFIRSRSLGEELRHSMRSEVEASMRRSEEIIDAEETKTAVRLTGEMSHRPSVTFNETLDEGADNGGSGLAAELLSRENGFPAEADLKRELYAEERM